MSLGIYIHVPFCLKKCPYCDFYSVKYEPELCEKYVDALCRNIMKYKGQNLTADTVYFGGGTPSLLTAGHIEKILLTCNNAFAIKNPEITIEANPCSVDLKELKDYKQAGVNRISFGVQSADNNQLKFLGRLHDFKKAETAVNNALNAGFQNISCDIMLGLAEQDLDSMCQTIEKITSFPVNHISAYMLKIEPSTPFDCDKIKQSVADEELQCDMYLKAVSLLEEKGFEQYEISNFAKDECYSKHNLKYWQGEDYLGFGPASHSFYNNKRFFVPKDIERFVNNAFQDEVVEEQSVDKLEEYIMLSLRLKWGINKDEIIKLGGNDFADKLIKKAQLYEKYGLCKVSEDNISLLPKGFLVSNSLIAEFVDSD